MEPGVKEPETMTVAELESLGERVERLLRERRLDEKVAEALPGWARFPRLDGEKGWLAAEKKNCGSDRCKKGCQEGRPSHGPYWHHVRPKLRGEGLTSDHEGRELRADLAAAYGLPASLDAVDAHRYSRGERRSGSYGSHGRGGPGIGAAGRMV
jgi:hypothetical protein